jgi:hypothetical protein
MLNSQRGGPSNVNVDRPCASQLKESVDRHKSHAARRRGRARRRRRPLRLHARASCLPVPCETATALFAFSPPCPFRVASNQATTFHRPPRPGSISRPRQPSTSGSVLNQLAYSEIPESEGRPTYRCGLAASLSAATSHRFCILVPRVFIRGELADPGNFYTRSSSTQPGVQSDPSPSPSSSWRAIGWF